ncbi:MAG: hypothetical protein LUH58_02325 [Lachnospiraceae bacterium]|nr:hypothetical protein [Lachnospiraceae bacterium]
MKKKLVLFLCVVMMLVLCSCRNSSEISEGSEQTEAADDNVDGDYQINEVMMGAYGVCVSYSYSENPGAAYHISEILYQFPRRFEDIDGSEYLSLIESVDEWKGQLNEGDTVVYTEDEPVFVRYYMESYTASDSVNSIDHKDVVLIKEGDDMIMAIQSPKNEESWSFLLVEDYGDWLLKEIELKGIGYSII